MANYTMSTAPVGREIVKAQKKLKKIRPHVSAANQKKIDLEIKALDDCHKKVRNFCRPTLTHLHSFPPAQRSYRR